MFQELSRNKSVSAIEMKNGSKPWTMNTSHSAVGNAMNMDTCFATAQRMKQITKENTQRKKTQKGFGKPRASAKRPGNSKGPQKRLTNKARTASKAWR
jgi:hypothetical protein